MLVHALRRSAYICVCYFPCFGCVPARVCLCVYPWLVYSWHCCGDGTPCVGEYNYFFIMMFSGGLFQFYSACLFVSRAALEREGMVADGHARTSSEASCMCACVGVVEGMTF